MLQAEQVQNEENISRTEKKGTIKLCDDTVLDGKAESEVDDLQNCDTTKLPSSSSDKCDSPVSKEPSRLASLVQVVSPETGSCIANGTVSLSDKLGGANENNDVIKNTSEANNSTTVESSCDLSVDKTFEIENIADKNDELEESLVILEESLVICSPEKYTSSPSNAQIEPDLRMADNSVVEITPSSPQPTAGIMTEHSEVELGEMTEHSEVEHGEMKEKSSSDNITPDVEMAGSSKDVQEIEMADSTKLTEVPDVDMGDSSDGVAVQDVEMLDSGKGTNLSDSCKGTNLTDVEMANSSEGIDAPDVEMMDSDLIDKRPELKNSSLELKHNSNTENCGDMDQSQVHIVNSYEGILKDSCTEHSPGKVITTGCNIETVTEAPISFSQKSIEFMDELSNECMITSVKPANVQYVEVSLDATSKDHDKTSKPSEQADTEQAQRDRPDQSGSSKPTSTKRVPLILSDSPVAKPAKFSGTEQPCSSKRLEFPKDKEKSTHDGKLLNISRQT